MSKRKKPRLVTEEELEALKAVAQEAESDAAYHAQCVADACVDLRNCNAAYADAKEHAKASSRAYNEAYDAYMLSQTENR